MKKIQKIPDPGKGETGFLPGLAIDTVIFGFHERQLRILILEYRNTGLFALPGGFITENEDLDAAALRMLSERTGLQDVYLEQFHVFGSSSRHDPSSMRTIMKKNKIKVSPGHWLLKRFVSVGYYALINFTKAVPRPDLMSDTCEWYDMKNLPPLIQDHEIIVQKALDTLRLNLDRRLIGFNLLPEMFTITDLQVLYETILDEKLNRSSFQRRILGLKILRRVEKKYSGGSHKAPWLYQFQSPVRTQPNIKASVIRTPSL
jgi:8-oxo-dGTP diphosphatase